ncbi:MAG: VWA domain-containing protein [Verrucomicrobia bacterium]|nr:VWA domain-containing protein [Verrucomicrobiota bacterium]
MSLTRNQQPSKRPDNQAAGLIGWLDQTRVQLPLKGVEVHFDLTGDLVEVGIDQIYYQNQNVGMDVTYSFPLPYGAAVYRCEMLVNGRSVVAKVTPVDEARRVAAEKKQLGHRTALVETVRDNLFELQLGNLAPGDTVVMRLGYLQRLERDGGVGEASFRIPLTPGVRYIPGRPLLRSSSGRGIARDTDQVPDASRITPPRIDSLHPDAAYFSVEGRVEPAGWDVNGFCSPSHALRVSREEGKLRVSLLGNAEVPDRDLVIRMRCASEGMATVGWETESEGYRYALVRLVAPPMESADQEAPRDFYFLADHSGSMDGLKWRACARAFREFLKKLGPLDRAWVTYYASDYRDHAEKPFQAATLLEDPAMANLEDWSPDGGTELLPALKHVLEVEQLHRSPGRRSVLVVLTDGELGNESAILNTLAARRGDLQVHTFGIGDAVNDAFLRRMAEENGGSSTLVAPQDDIPGLVAGLARKMGSRVLGNLRAEGPWEVTGKEMPSLWAGDAVTLSVRSADPTAQLVLWGEAEAGGREMSFPIPLEPAAGPGPRLLWQREKIQVLDGMKLEEEAAALACAANLLSQTTAFLAWDEAERVLLPGPNLEVDQPSMMLASSACDGVILQAPPAMFFSLSRDVGHRFRRSLAPSVLREDNSWPLRRLWQSWFGPDLDSLAPLLGLKKQSFQALADLLRTWMEADASLEAERKLAWYALISSLKTSDDPQQRFGLFEAWVSGNLEGEAARAVLRELDSLKKG